MLQAGKYTAHFGITLRWDNDDKIWIAAWTSVQAHGNTKKEALAELGFVLDRFDDHLPDLNNQNT